MAAWNVGSSSLRAGPLPCGLSVLMVTCSVLWLPCAKGERVQIRGPWASEVICKFLHVPVSEEQPWLFLHFQRCPRPRKGQRPHCPRACSRNQGIKPFSMSKHTISPLRPLVEGKCAGLVQACEGEEWVPRSGWLSEQNAAPPDSLPTVTTQAAENSSPLGLWGRWPPPPSSVNLISKLRASSPGGGAPSLSSNFPISLGPYIFSFLLAAL